MKYKLIVSVIIVLGSALIIGVFNWSKSIEIEKEVKGGCEQSWNIN